MKLHYKTFKKEKTLNCVLIKELRLDKEALIDIRPLKLKVQL